MRATATPTMIRKGKGRLLESCAITAGLMALAVGGPALAQVAGTGNVVSGGATISPPTSDAPTNVFTNSDQTIIDWTPSNTPVAGVVDFLPDGNTLNFYGTGDYVVLNRFVSGAGTPITDQVALNGTVRGFNSSSQGGNIWFYNAGGILIGSTGVINVGSLVLTANDIDTSGGLFGPGGTIRFRGAASTSAVTVNGNINASNPFNPGSSYIALVAPRVVQAGNVRVDGSAAYVAAEQADIRINNGLFDINVLVGAAGGNVITHSGTTTGPAHQQGDSNQNRIYMVAIPKNDAVTMLVSGAIGYDDALSAQTDPDGAVRLSAGYNITNGELNTAPVSAVAANITASDTLFRSDTIARASGAFAAQPTQQLPSSPSPLSSAGQFFVEGNGTFIGDTSATISIGAGQSGGATGALTLQSGGTTVNGTSQGGTASFTQTGGDVSTGSLTVSANGVGDIATGQSGAGIGGTASINLLGGTITAADILASASGVGGYGSTGGDIDPFNPTAGGQGGIGQGGSATITIDGSAAINASTIAAYAQGRGGNGGDFIPSSSASAPGVTGNGGNGTGGDATISVRPGTIIASSLVADASGTGGNGGESFSSSGGGAGTGGTGGNGQGGNATVRFAAAVGANSLVSSIAQGVGGAGGAHNVGGNGGAGFGGLAQSIIDNFDAGAFAVTLDASAQGGAGANGNNGNGGNGGNAVGGNARALAQGALGNMTVQQVDFRTDSIGGNGGNGRFMGMANPATTPAGGAGGSGQGGTLEIAANDGATMILGTGSSAPVSLGSVGTGGNGGNGASIDVAGAPVGGNGGNAGAGQGGTVALRANGGTITSNGGTVNISVNGVSGVGGNGGNGGGGPGASGNAAATTGGRAAIEALSGPNGAGQIGLGDTNIAASGDNAGRIELRAEGTITMASLTAAASGTAAPTNNDTGTATSGIFLAASGGTIATSANMALTTDGSIGVYGQGAGTVRAGTGLSINAADQVDIRHDQRSGSTPTLSAADEVTIIAGTSLSAASGSLIGSDASLSLIANGPNGAIGIDRLDAANIFISSTAAASVEHAETSGNFTVEANSFRTGPNSIITGGDIIMTSPGAIDLGNSSAGGFVSVNGQSIAFNSIAAGGSVFLNASGTAPGAEGISGNIITSGGNVVLRSAGNVTIATSVAANGGWADPNGMVAEGNLFVDAAGDAALTGASAARMVGVNAGQAATITGGSAGEDLLILAGSTATLSDFTAGDDAEIRAPGAITAQNVRTTGLGADTRALTYNAGSGFTIGSDIGGDSSIRTRGGDTTLGNLDAFDDVDASSTSAVTITAPVVAGRDIGIGAVSVDIANLGGGAVDGLDAGRNLQVITSGAITGGAVRSGGNLQLAAGTAVDIARVTSGGATSLNSSSGAVDIDSLSSTGTVNIGGQAIRVAGGSGNLVLGQINAATGDAAITNSGDIILANGVVAGRASLTSTNGAVDVAQLSANAIDLSARGNMTLASVSAAQALNARAGAMLTLSGVVTGGTMSLTSNDMTIGSGGRAGTGGVTQRLDIANGDSGRQTFVGGTGTRSGYHIDADEMARLYANDIRISGPAIGSGSSAGSGAPPAVIIDNFTMAGGNSGSNLGANGSLTIATPATARVIGNVQLTGLTDANALNLIAGDRVEVIMGQGSVRLTGVNSTPAGQLNLTGGSVIVATLAAIADVDAATSTSAIDKRLAENDGVTSDEGALFARGIRADVDGGFYVQNSGTGTATADRRGLTFGVGGLDVVTSGRSRIVINGAHLGPSGQVTGFDTLALLTIAGGLPANAVGSFDRQSTLNGCLIANSGACVPSTNLDVSFPVQDVIEDQADPDAEKGEGNNLPAPLITMRDIDPLTGEPLLDDPVTGAGNDDLWTPPAE